MRPTRSGNTSSWSQPSAWTHTRLLESGTVVERAGQLTPPPNGQPHGAPAQPRQAEQQLVTTPPLINLRGSDRERSAARGSRGGRGRSGSRAPRRTRRPWSITIKTNAKKPLTRKVRVKNGRFALTIRFSKRHSARPGHPNSRFGLALTKRASNHPYMAALPLLVKAAMGVFLLASIWWAFFGPPPDQRDVGTAKLWGADLGDPLPRGGVRAVRRPGIAPVLVGAGVIALCLAFWHARGDDGGGGGWDDDDGDGADRLGPLRPRAPRLGPPARRRLTPRRQPDTKRRTPRTLVRSAAR